MQRSGLGGKDRHATRRHRRWLAYHRDCAHHAADGFWV